MNWLSVFLDISLMCLLITGIVYAIKLSRQLTEMRAGRHEMERFVIDFSTTVARAENGIRGLKSTARSSGDDLEKLIDKANNLRDELHFLVESADQIAERLSSVASAVTRQNAPASQTVAPRPSATKTSAMPKEETIKQKSPAEALSTLTSQARSQGNSAAERELMRALKKIG